MLSIILISSNELINQQFTAILNKKHQITCFSKIDLFLQASSSKYDYVFLDYHSVIEEAGNQIILKTTLDQLYQFFSFSQITLIIANDSLNHILNFIKNDIKSYLTLPLKKNDVENFIKNYEDSKRKQLELNYLRGEFWENNVLGILRTNSPLMKEVFEKIRSVAPTKTSILLEGETGVGKGMLAKLIHNHSSRKDKTFLHIHCGAIPDTLIESELFGHEKGSFTGAVKLKIGKFEIAHGGTIFLDEVGTLTPSAQIKLLQVLQDKILQRIGGQNTIETDVRIIAASNANLKQMCKEGLFRADLYYRLSVFPIQIPALRERIVDIPLLVEEFFKKLNGIHLKRINEMHPLVINALSQYSWPGNIRELENVMERAYIIETSSVLTPENFPPEIFNVNDETKTKVPLDISLPLSVVRKRGIEQIERQYLKEVLACYQGKIKQVAEVAGIGTRQLHKLLTKYKIRKEEFKRAVFNRN